MNVRDAVTVSMLTDCIQRKFKEDDFLSAVIVTGEISNFKHHNSGHLYFTLKDPEAQIKCVMFRSSAEKLRFMPSSGAKVIASGRVDVYKPNGEYQLYVSFMEPEGLGALYAEFEKLKAELASEGLFDSSKKRPLPYFPGNIGIVTAPGGAALQDMLNITKRRAPWCNITVFPSLVQGDGAAPELISGIRYFNENMPVDVIIIGRGGGSFEDLNAFNDRQLAYAVAGSRIPVISAVGHETDFTICDFAADVRAPTPSAAAELAVPDINELEQGLMTVKSNLYSRIRQKIEKEKLRLDGIASSRAMSSYSNYIDDKRLRLDSAFSAMENGIKVKLIEKKAEFSRSAIVLQAQSPLATLSKGYSLVTKEGKNIRSSHEIEKGDELDIRFATGSALVEVTEVYGNGK